MVAGVGAGARTEEFVMRRLAHLVLGTLGALTLSACVVAPYPAHPAYGAPVYGPAGAPVVVTDVAPPPLYVEPVPPVPFAGAVWIGGYWGWSGGRHAWVPGRWEHPRPGYTWEPHRWENHAGRWELHGGRWRQS
jgi:hypothetical protein